MISNIIISSFDPIVVRELAGGLIPVGLLTEARHPADGRTSLNTAIQQANDLGAAALHAETAQLTVANPASLVREIAKVHDARLALLVWCPRPAEAIQLVRANADAVCVDQVAETVTGL